MLTWLHVCVGMHAPHEVDLLVAVLLQHHVHAVVLGLLPEHLGGCLQACNGFTAAHASSTSCHVCVQGLVMVT